MEGSGFYRAGQDMAEQGVAAEIISTAKACIAGLREEGSTLPLSERAPQALEDFIEALETLCPDRETDPDRFQWSAAARQFAHEFLDTLRTADRADPGSLPAPVLVRAGAEAIRWDIVCRHTPDAELWAWLDELFAATYGIEVQRVRGAAVDVARETLRAIAYHAAALDQQPLKTSFAIARLIAVMLPDLFLTRERAEGAVYGVDIAQRGIPSRQPPSPSDEPPFEGWWFVTEEAMGKLSDIHADLIRGLRPIGLETQGMKELHAAVLHLRRQWSSAPPMRRHRRYPLDARLSVVQGFDETMNLLGEMEEAVAAGTGIWRITDMSRCGVGAVTPRNIRLSVPVAGDLVAFCIEEGTRWHVGVVRRVRTTDTQVEIGIATLSDSPELARVDDGRVPRELCVCDPVRRGEIVRLVAPLGTLGENDPLFVLAKKSVVHKLRPLADALRGKSFDLRVYQVT